MTEAAGFADEPRPRARSSPGDWRGGTAVPSKGRLTALALILLLAVAGAIAALLHWPEATAPPRLDALGVSEYGPMWQINPWAQNDAALLQTLFEASGHASRGEAVKFPEWLAAVSAKSGDGLSEKVFRSRPHLVYLSAHAVVLPEGVGLLLPGVNPNSFEASVRIVPLDDVLKAVAESPAEHKLLLLNLAHPNADPFNGILLDDVAAALHAHLTAKDSQLPCPVLVACSPGQRSLPCDPERASAFAFYLAEGLRGAADGELDGTADGEIRASELVPYAIARVDRWAERTANVRQTPRLYPATARLDFVLARSRESNADEPRPRAYPKELADAWTLREETPPRLPASRAAATAALLRAEQHCFRNGDEGSAGKECQAARDWLTRERLESSRQASDSDKLTGALRRCWLTPAPRPPPDEAVRAALEQFLRTSADDKAQDDKARGEWSQAIAKKEAEAARLVWECAVAGPVADERQLRRLADAMAAANVAAIESLLLARLAANPWRDRPDVVPYPLTAALALVRSDAALAQFAQLPSAGFAQWSDAASALADRRRDAERSLVAARGNAAADEAGRKLAVIAGECEVLRATLLAWQSAQAAWEAGTAALLESLRPAIEHDQPAFADWRKLAAALVALNAQLTADDMRSKPVSVEAVRAVTEAAAKLPLWRLETKGADPKDVAAASLRARRLCSPGLGGAARVELWTQCLIDQQTLHDQVRSLDRIAGKLPSPTPVNDGGPRESAVRRAEASVLLLNLAGQTPLADIEAALEVVKRERGNVAAWQSLGQLLRQTWQTRLPERMAAAPVARKARALRIMPAELARYRNAESLSDPAPLELAAGDRQAKRAWMSRLLADFAAVRDPSAAGFYEQSRSLFRNP